MKKLLPLTLFVFIFNLFYAQDFEWAKQFAGNGNFDGSRSISIDNHGNVYVLGNYSGITDFDPSIITYSLNTNGTYLTKLDANGGFVWVKKIAGAVGGGGGIHDITAIDDFENIIIASSLNGTEDCDPGVGVFNLTGGGETLITKLNPQGNFIWAKLFGGQSTGVALDTLDNIYISGSFQGTIDFDPSISTYTMSSVGSYAGFINKIDSSGNFIWAKQISGNQNEACLSISISPSNNLYVSGYFNGNTDFDPGVNTYSLVTIGGGYICKLNTNGDFIWARQFEVTSGSNCAPRSIDFDKLENVYTVGGFYGTCDFDPSVNTHTFINSGSFISKLDSSGNFIWAKQIKSTGSNCEGWSVAVDSSSNAYISGVCSYVTDLDPGPGIYNDSTASNINNSYVLKLNSLGDFIWANTIANSFYSSLTIDYASNIYHIGTFNSIADFDPSASTYSLTAFAGWGDIYVAKLSQGICSNLTLIVDSVANITCANNTAYCATHGANGLTPYDFTWNTSPVNHNPIITFTTAGIYSIMMKDSNNCTRSRSILINNYGASTGFDLNTNLIANSFRSGFNSNIWLDAFNDGCSLTNGQLKLILDNKINYNSSSPAPTAISGDTLIWDFGSINFDSAHVKPYISIKTPSTTLIGDTVCLQTIVTPINLDYNPSNNIKTYCFPVINGYDPNDKQVYPKGRCTPGYILNNQLLTYTVRFQNTGNASAINITVLDSLDTDLDLNTVKVIGSSHTMYTEVLPNNILKFHFNNINLADSTSDEIGSHGYVIFEVMPLPARPITTEIKNKADIYFDFNVPVATNKELNTIIDVLPVNCNLTTGINLMENNSASLYPNPNTGKFSIALNSVQSHFEVEITNLMGQMVKKNSGSNTNKLDLELESPAGIYFAKIISPTEQYIIKIIKQ